MIPFMVRSYALVSDRWCERESSARLPISHGNLERPLYSLTEYQPDELPVQGSRLWRSESPAAGERDAPYRRWLSPIRTTLPRHRRQNDTPRKGQTLVGIHSLRRSRGTLSQPPRLR